MTSELKLLKDILQSKRAKRSGVRRSHSAHVHSDANKEQIRSSVSSSLYKSEYSPDKYTSGRRSTRSRGGGGSREYGGERRRDSGSGSSRKARDDTDGIVSEGEWCLFTLRRSDRGEVVLVNVSAFETFLFILLFM